MRKFIIAILVAFSTLIFMGCGGVDEPKKAEIFDADQKQCNLVFAKRDYMYAIEADTTPEELLKICLAFKKEHLGAHCSRNETITDRNGRQRTIKDDYTVTESICDKYK